MSAARRLYLYVVSAVSLAAVAAGLFNLVSVLVDALVPSGGAIGGDLGQPRSQASLAIALVLVGLPVWLLHWGVAERGVRRAGDRGDDDRRSALRAGYLLVAEAVALAALVAGGLGVLSQIAGAVLGVAGERWPVDATAAFAVATPIWLYHAFVVETDARRMAPMGAAARLPRLYRYGAAFAVLLLGLGGIRDAIGTTLQAAIATPVLDGEDWWRIALGSALASGIVGLGAWWAHWAWCARYVAPADPDLEDDRTSHLRAAYFGAVTLATIAMVAVAVVASLSSLGQWLAGIGSTEMTAFLESVVGPPIAVVPFVVAGWLHVLARRNEAADLGPAARAASDRLTRHLVALEGLALVGIGAAQLVSLAIDVAFGGPAVGGETQVITDLSWALAILGVGLVVWLPAWLAVLRHRRAEPDAERGATIERAYLYLAVGSALVAGVPTAAYVLYRVIDAALGASTPVLIHDVAMPLAVVIVAAGVAAYHGWLLARDLRASAERAPAPALATMPEAAAPAPAIAPEVTVELVLHGSPDLDVDGVVAALRRTLPAGCRIDRLPAGPPAHA